MSFGVNKYYYYESQNAMLENSCVTPIIDTLQSDMETLPPLAGKRQPGRPKETRYKPTSKFAHPTASTNKCSKCGKVGHNSATCAFVEVDGQTQQTEATILLSNLETQLTQTQQTQLLSNLETQLTQTQQTQLTQQTETTETTEKTNLLSSFDDEMELEDIEEPTYEDMFKA